MANGGWYSGTFLSISILHLIMKNGTEIKSSEVIYTFQVKCSSLPLDNFFLISNIVTSKGNTRWNIQTTSSIHAWAHMLLLNIAEGRSMLMFGPLSLTCTILYSHTRRLLPWSLVCEVTRRWSMQLPGKQMRYYPSAAFFPNISRLGFEKVFRLCLIIGERMVEQPLGKCSEALITSVSRSPMATLSM